MATTYWTLIYHPPGGAPVVELSLADWSLRQMRINYNGLDDTCTFQQAGTRVDDADAFAFRTICEIWQGRTLESDGVTYTGGFRRFYGIVISAPHTATGDKEYVSYTLKGPGWFLSNRTYEIPYKTFAGYVTPGDPTSGSTFNNLTSGHLWLNRDINQVWLCTGEMIELAVQWAISKGAPIQLLADVPVTINPGVVGFTRSTNISAGIKTFTDVPVDEVVDITCAEVVQKEIRWNPDCVVWFDYTTTPYPTFMCYRQQYLTPVDVTLLDGGLYLSGKITPRYDLQRPYVQISFETLSQIDGLESFQVTKQTYPTSPPAEAFGQFGPLVATIRLLGARGSNTKVQIKTVAIPAVGASSADLLTFLQQYEPWLNDPATIQSAIVTSPYTRNGSLNYAMAASSGQMVDWITNSSGNPVNFSNDVLTFRVTINYVNGQIEEKVLPVNITQTDLNTGGVLKTFTHFTGSPFNESPPPNMAKDLYDALSVLQYTAQFESQAAECDNTIGMGMKVNISDITEYSAMNGVVQEVTLDVDKGHVSYRVAPNRLLTAGEYIDLLRITRYRLVLMDPTTRNASVDQSTTSSIGDATPAGTANAGAGFKQVVVASDDPTGQNNRVTAGKYIDPNSVTQNAVVIENQKDALIAVIYNDAFGGSTDPDPTHIRLRKIGACVVNADGTTTPGFIIALCSGFTTS